MAPCYVKHNAGNRMPTAVLNQLEVLINRYIAFAGLFRPESIRIFVRCVGVIDLKPGIGNHSRHFVCTSGFHHGFLATHPQKCVTETTLPDQTQALGKRQFVAEPGKCAEEASALPEVMSGSSHQYSAYCP